MLEYDKRSKKLQKRTEMNKPKEIIIENLKAVNTIIEVLDARAPISSRNEEIKRLIKDKNRIIVINKADLITKEASEELENHFKKELKYSVCLSAKEGTSIKRLYYILEALYKSKAEKFAKRGIKALPLKVLILGIPNVGKSHLINAITGRNIVNVENRPGSTRGKQWINILPNVQLLDTPGVLWMVGRRESIRKLEMIGNVKPTNIEEVSNRIIELIKLKTLKTHYNLEIESKEEFFPKLLTSLNSDDFNRAYNLFIEDFRKGNLGKIPVEEIMKG